MIDDFLTTPDDLPPMRPRRPAAPARAAPGAAVVALPTVPRAALAAGVALAVSMLGAAPVAAAGSSQKQPLPKSTPAAEDSR